MYKNDDWAIRYHLDLMPITIVIEQEQEGIYIACTLSCVQLLILVLEKIGGQFWGLGGLQSIVSKEVCPSVCR